MVYCHVPVRAGPIKIKHLERPSWRNDERSNNSLFGLFKKKSETKNKRKNKKHCFVSGAHMSLKLLHT